MTAEKAATYPVFPTILYGGDYNPDQWPEEVWEEDMRLFRLAHLNVATLPVFGWSRLQPAEDVYDFAWLDALLDKLWDNGIHVCLATATAAQPPWMSHKYPEMLPVDKNGMRRRHGGRVNFCPNSPVYRHFAAELVRRLADRYAHHPALIAWHVGNEYGTYCYCDVCADVWRDWLKARYKTLEALNKAWNTAFWGHLYRDWEEIVPPDNRSNNIPRSRPADSSVLPGMSLDYMRFMSESSLACYRAEYDILKLFTPDIPVTTNLMGTFKPLDYFAWAPNLDIVSWDNYPVKNADMASIAFRHDLMRGLKNGQPFMLMEQTPNQQNWQAYNAVKRPGELRRLSWQAVAHGADTVMYFQLRQSVAGCEKFHGAVISHAGHEHTRVFRDVAQLGEELQKVSPQQLGPVRRAEAAILFDWENWWALEMSSGPSQDLQYVPFVEQVYRAFWQQHLPVDILHPGQDFSSYKVVVAPLMYLLHPGFSERIKAHVRAGGTFVTTFFSGLVDEHDRVFTGGSPGEWWDLLGLWVEETDALMPEESNHMRFVQPLGRLQGAYQCGLLCDLVHLEGATALAVYGEDFYAGMPCLTENRFGAGRAYYLATCPDAVVLTELIQHVCAEQGIQPLLDAPAGVEVVDRQAGEQVHRFVVNHRTEPVTLNLTASGTDILSSRRLAGEVQLNPGEVWVVRTDAPPVRGE
ncbi:beta-galactosidase [Alicyclobacillus herbarius]|uniref:beta-galactosidase n=1 Tax=Alicyclobacillus herbarius TaxID=122960 RepID=UPI00042A6F03|nr:beta-galactosidase [Alicyclobacillus herbarius]